MLGFLDIAEPPVEQAELVMHREAGGHVLAGLLEPRPGLLQFPAGQKKLSQFQQGLPVIRIDPLSLPKLSFRGLAIAGFPLQDSKQHVGVGRPAFSRGPEGSS